MIEHFSIRFRPAEPEPSQKIKPDLLGTIWINGRKYGGIIPVEEKDLKDAVRFFRLVQLAVVAARKAAKKHFAEASEGEAPL